MKSTLLAERQYKSDAHKSWQEELDPERFREMLIRGRYIEIADRAVAIEARTNLLFSFEKMTRFVLLGAHVHSQLAYITSCLAQALTRKSLALA